MGQYKVVALTYFTQYSNSIENYHRTKAIYPITANIIEYDQKLLYKYSNTCNYLLIIKYLI